MGLFVDRQYNQQTSSNSNACYVNNNCGQYYGSYSFGHMLLESLPSLFMYGVQQFGESDSVDDGKGGKTDPKPSSDTPAATQNEELQAKIKEKNDELQKLYDDNGVKDADALDTKISELNGTVNDLKTKVNGAEDVLKNGTSADIKAEIEKYYDFETGAIKKDANGNEIAIPAGVKDFSTLKDDYQKAVDAENVIADNKPKLESAQVELMQFKTVKGEAENILLEIKELQSQETGVDYNVVQETNDIKSFMEKLTAFKENKNYNTALALKTAYENNGTDKESGIQQKTIKTAWDLVAKQVEEQIAKGPAQAV